ncbi:MAG TPA: ATP-binding protein, partial [Eubacterium sp.]|nr:ATP-binding protein [Eubacterium sp.]
YLECPDCGKHIPVFGESKIDEIAKELGIDVLGKMPIMTKSASLADKGAFDLSENKYIEDATNKLIKLESE